MTKIFRNRHTAFLPIMVRAHVQMTLSHTGPDQPSEPLIPCASIFHMSQHVYHALLLYAQQHMWRLTPMLFFQLEDVHAMTRVH